MTSRHSTRAGAVPAAALLALLAAGCATPASENAAHSPDSAVQEPAPVATHAPGDTAVAHWTATTYEAASAEANQAVLRSGQPVTVTGEVVDVSCFLQLGKRGEAHVPCGTKCIQNGEPVGIVDDQGHLYVLFAEEHHPRRDGQVELPQAMLPHLAQRVTVTGMLTETGGHRALFVPMEHLDRAVVRAAAG
jgi:hypothetical protein